MQAETPRDSGVTVEVRGAVGRIVLSRPQKLNALRAETFATIGQAIAECEARPDVRALLLTGSGRAFCAGADLTDPMLGNHLPRDERGAACARTLDGVMNSVIRALRRVRLPTVCAVNGAAAGGGVGLALAADIVLAARSARFSITFTPKLGLIPDLGTSWHLTRNLGRARALGLILTGESLSAEDAAAGGLVWKVVDDDALDAEALRLAAALASGPGQALLEARQLVDAAAGATFDAQLDHERDAQARLVQTADADEAMAAFAEKRPPRFQGR